MRSLSTLPALFLLLLFLLLHLQPISAQSHDSDDSDDSDISDDFDLDEDLPIFELLKSETCIPAELDTIHEVVREAIYYSQLAVRVIEDAGRPSWMSNLLHYLFAPTKLYQQFGVQIPTGVKQVSDLDRVQERFQAVVDTLLSREQLPYGINMLCGDDSLPEENRQCQIFGVKYDGFCPCPLSKDGPFESNKERTVAHSAFVFTNFVVPEPQKEDDVIKDLVFCDPFFAKPVFDELQPQIGTPLVEMLTTGSFFLHEWLHVLFNLPDLAYGFSDCVRLVKGEFKLVRNGKKQEGPPEHNPDSYAFLAAGMFDPTAAIIDPSI